MIGALLLVVIGVLVPRPSHEQSTPASPCPNVFSYEPSGTEQGRWYGVVNLSTDSTLHSLWLNVVLDSKADILGNWIGDVTTTDNTDFEIVNKKIKIHPGPTVAVCFFVQYDVNKNVPRLRAIRLNGREICNADHPQPAVEIINLDPTSISARPEFHPPSWLESMQTQEPESRPNDRLSESTPVQRPTDKTPTEIQTRPTIIIRPENMFNTNPVYGSETGDGPVYVPTPNPIEQSKVKTYDAKIDRIDPDKNDWSPGPVPVEQLSFVFGSGNKNSDQCGIVRNNSNPLVVNGRPTYEGQWPWQVALYRSQSEDSKYICGGTLVSHQHVVTAAHCVTRKPSPKPVNKHALIIYLGKHNLGIFAEGMEIRFVADIIVHPEYNRTFNSRDLSILRMHKPVEYTEFVRAACLWPDNQIALNNVVGKKGSVVGWGLDITGVATEELMLVEMPVVDQETCLRSHGGFFVPFTDRDYTYCAGSRDGTSVCNGDSGGGMVFRMNGVWYLRGLVSLSVANEDELRCDPTHYVVFTDLAKFLPWIREHIGSSIEN